MFAILTSHMNLRTVADFQGVESLGQICILGRTLLCAERMVVVVVGVLKEQEGG